MVKSGFHLPKKAYYLQSSNWQPLPSTSFADICIHLVFLHLHMCVTNRKGKKVSPIHSGNQKPDCDVFVCEMKILLPGALTEEFIQNGLNFLTNCSKTVAAKTLWEYLVLAHFVKTSFARFLTFSVRLHFTILRSNLGSL